MENLGSGVSEGDACEPAARNEGKEGASLMTNPLFILEAGEIETRLRKHAVELTEPAIARTALFERKLLEARSFAERNAETLKGLSLKLSGQEALKTTIESFRSDLFEWDKERREHQELMNEKMCLQEDELSTLRKKLELQSFSTEACNRGLKSLGDLLAETKNELSEIRSYCSDRINVNRDKIMKLRDEFESRNAATESVQFKLRDDVTHMATIAMHLQAEMDRVGALTSCTMEGIADLWRAKATVASVQEQQDTFAEFSRSLTDAVESLRLQLGSVVGEVKEHFQTAAQVMSASTSKQIASMRSQYAHDTGRMDDIMSFGQVSKWSLSDSNLRFWPFHFEPHLSSSERNKPRQAAVNHKAKPDPLSEEYVLEVKQLRRSCKEQAEQLAGFHRARALERDAMQAIIESQRIAAQMSAQDDQDRKHIALFGAKTSERHDGMLPSIEAKSAQTPRKKDTSAGLMPVVSLDKRCLSCCGGAGSVLAGFKIACLNYTPGPVEYRQSNYSRADLLQLQSKLADQAQDRMHRAEGV
ncbi:unnamed protein product, partial [Effrenium voratum]